MLTPKSTTVYDMSWFITKGSPVTEDKSFVKHYHKVWRVSEGPRQSVAQDILMFEDLYDTGMSPHSNANIRGWVKIKVGCPPTP